MSSHSLLIKNLKAQEGCIPHMYLDTRGYVTVAVGQLLASAADAQALPFLHRNNGKPASAETIAAEYENVKKQKPALIAQSYKKHTELELAQTNIDALLESRILEFKSGLRSNLPNYDSCPVSAQEALLDMAFNLGINGLINKFPTLVRNVKSEDWNGCAKECKRRGISDQRNLETQHLFEQAAKV